MEIKNSRKINLNDVHLLNFLCLENLKGKELGVDDFHVKSNYAQNCPIVKV